jgi:hypothetical protein
MTNQYRQLQISSTKALLKFIQDHQGYMDVDLSECLRLLESDRTRDAISHARMVKPHGMGGVTDWFPQPIVQTETVEYNAQVLRALVNEWCRVISLSFEEHDPVSRDAQKGEIAAVVRSDGYVLCPFCRKTFSSLSSSWDGIRHTTCGVRLSLTPEAPDAA